MADEKPSGVTGLVGGWVKTLAASAVSLVSGAVIMYLTPVVNNAIKPPKPISNFATQATGLTVNFNNRSTGGVEGWWDFGDGSALEPFDPKAENVTHVYPRAGTFQVKLSLTNSLGEANDRTASVVIDADAPAGVPVIEQFELKPLDKREIAPAVYRLACKVKNASHCMLCCGDTRPMEVIESIANQERYITFDEAGSYTIRMAAVSGKQVVEQTRTIYVGGNDGSVPMAKLLVSYEAVKVERFIKPERIYVGWQGDTKPASVSFRRERMAETGATIQSAELVNQGAGAPVKNVKCEIAPDKSKIILTGELVRPTGPLAKDGAAPHWVAELKVAQERRGPKRTINRGDVAMTVDWNSTVRIPMQPLPDGYEIVAKKVTLQLWDGPRKAWEGNKAVTNAQVTMNNKTCLVTAVPQSDSFLVSLSSPGPVLQPVGFERNPLKLPKQK